MSDYEQAVFISSAWKGESEEIVNQIDQALQARGIKIIRDKRDLRYKGSIREFMQRIGQGNCVIVVISDKYLRSKNCMYELVEIAENKQFADRIFRVVLSDAKIYDLHRDSDPSDLYAAIEKRIQENPVRSGGSSGPARCGMALPRCAAARAADNSRTIQVCLARAMAFGW